MKAFFKLLGKFFEIVNKFDKLKAKYQKAGYGKKILIMLSMFLLVVLTLGCEFLAFGLIESLYSADAGVRYFIFVNFFILIGFLFMVYLTIGIGFNAIVSLIQYSIIAFSSLKSQNLNNPNTDVIAERVEIKEDGKVDSSENCEVKTEVIFKENRKTAKWLDVVIGIFCVLLIPVLIGGMYLIFKFF